MLVLAVILALGLLMFFAYLGFPVILFAPIFAMTAALLSGFAVMPAYTNIFMHSAAGYLELYFPIFLLGAVFGKVMEVSGAAASVAQGVVRLIGRRQAILAVVLACAVLTYGGVSLFVVVFAVYPFAVSLFREADIPKRLIPGTIALGAFTFTMDAFPGTPQIQNIIPTSFFKTDAFAAPTLGIIGGLFVLVLGWLYLEWRRKSAQQAGEGYGEGHVNEPDLPDTVHIPHVGLSLLPLLAVLLLNWLFTGWVKHHYGVMRFAEQIYGKVDVAKAAGVWALVLALALGIVIAVLINPRVFRLKLSKALTAGTTGSLLAIMNTASEVGFGSVISALPGFGAIKQVMAAVSPSPLVNEAISVNVLAGITGSASGGLSIALTMMGKQYLDAASAAGISPEVLHRVASMAAGGMDTLPHNGAVITLLAVTGLTHKQSYRDIFAITVLKTATVFVVIGLATLGLK